MADSHISSDIALDLLRAGLSVLPAFKAQKRPTIGKWNNWRARLPTEVEIKAWFANLPDALCLICGKVSGNLEVIDFDNHGELFPAWQSRISPELLDKLVVEQTQSGGFHVAYRCADEIDGNMKLAQGIRNDKLSSLIETRGNGGLIIASPTDGYTLTQGDFCHLPIISSDERKELLEAGFQLNEHQPEVKQSETVTCDNSVNFLERPGDAFNHLGNVKSLLIQHGWTHVLNKDGAELFRRPGKKDDGWSASLKDGVFYVFSTNAFPFEAGKGYSPFQVYAMLRHGGEFKAAAHDLFLNGYGTADNFADVDLSQFNVQSTALQPHLENTILSLHDLMEKYPAMRPPLIHGLLREGETMNVVAAPKTGKSWLAMDLAVSVAAGLPWFGFPCEQGKVLYIDNELHGETSAHRLPKVVAARGLDIARVDKIIFIDSQRGRLRDINHLGEMVKTVKELGVKLIIIDAFYRALPPKTDENDNGSIAQLYNRLDQYADFLGCAVVLIHHTSKGNQAMKSLTDVGAGAGSQSRAADAHLVLRPHDEGNVIVLESSVRSFPPVEPVCMRWNYPLWEIAPELDPKQLFGRAEDSRKREKIAPETLAEIAAALVGNEPMAKGKFVTKVQTELSIGYHKAREVVDQAVYLGLIAEREDKDSTPPHRVTKKISRL